MSYAHKTLKLSIKYVDTENRNGVLHLNSLIISSINSYPVNSLSLCILTIKIFGHKMLLEVTFVKHFFKVHNNLHLITINEWYVLGAFLSRGSLFN